MSAQHTPEPWSVENVEFCAEVTDDLCIMAASPSFREIAQISRCYQGDRVKEMEQANARRIVAAVNACTGIPTDQLEIEPYIGSVSYKMRMQAEQQRDELLAVLKQIEKYVHDDFVAASIGAVIAKAEGRS